MERSGWNGEHEGYKTCLCGRSFSQPNAFSKHKRACQKSKERLSSALDQAKQMWTAKKRRRLNPMDDPIVSEPLLAGLVHAPSLAIQNTVQVRHKLLF